MFHVWHNHFTFSMVPDPTTKVQFHDCFSNTAGVRFSDLCSIVFNSISLKWIDRNLGYARKHIRCCEYRAKGLHTATPKSLEWTSYKQFLWYHWVPFEYGSPLVHHWFTIGYHCPKVNPSSKLQTLACRQVPIAAWFAPCGHGDWETLRFGIFLK